MKFPDGQPLKVDALISMSDFDDDVKITRALLRNYVSATFDNLLDDFMALNKKESRGLKITDVVIEVSINQVPF